MGAPKSGRAGARHGAHCATRPFVLAAIALSFALAPALAWAESVFPSRPDDPAAVAIRFHVPQQVVQTAFRNASVGVSIDRDYSDQMWLKDARFEDVTHGRHVRERDFAVLDTAPALPATRRISPSIDRATCS
jgi:hypothetical protein